MEDNNKNIELIPLFEKSIFYPLIDEGLDFVEIGIDSVINEGLLNELPIAKSFFAVGKTINSIWERVLLRNTYYFIREFNSGDISRQKYEKYKQKIEEDPKKAEKELGRVLIYLDRQIEIIQSQILGAFFSAYIDERIDWEKFCELAEINSRMFISDYIMLAPPKKERFPENRNEIDLDREHITKEDRYRLDRLVNLGLLTNSCLHSSMRYPGEDWRSDYGLTEVGITFIKEAKKLIAR